MRRMDSSLCSVPYLRDTIIQDEDDVYACAYSSAFLLDTCISTSIKYFVLLLLVFMLVLWAFSLLVLMS